MFIFVLISFNIQMLVDVSAKRCVEFMFVGHHRWLGLALFLSCTATAVELA